MGISISFISLRAFALIVSAHPTAHANSDGTSCIRAEKGRAVKRAVQGGKRPGGETGSPLLGQCVMRRRTGTSAPSALPVQLMAAKNLRSTNRK